MNSEPKDLFSATTENGTSQPEAVFVLTIPGRLPSWNEILGLEHWGRYKLKKELAASFLSALRASAGSSSMRTTSVKNSLSTYADTLESYLATQQAKRKLRSLKKKLEDKARNISASKYLKLNEKPPF